jgi:hypothetical protein
MVLVNTFKRPAPPRDLLSSMHFCPLASFGQMRPTLIALPASSGASISAKKASTQGSCGLRICRDLAFVITLIGCKYSRA